MHPFAYADVPPTTLGDRTSFEDYQLYPSPDPGTGPDFLQNSAQFQLQLSQLQSHPKRHYFSAYTPWIDGPLSPHIVSPLPLMESDAYLAVHPSCHLASPWSSDLSTISGAESPRSSCDGSFAPSNLMETYPSPPSTYDDPNIPPVNGGRYPSPVMSATGSVALPQIQSYPDLEPIMDSTYRLSPAQPFVYSKDIQPDETDIGTDDVADRKSALPSPGPRKSRRTPQKTLRSNRVTKPAVQERSRPRAGSSPTFQRSSGKKTAKKSDAPSRIFICSFSHYGCTSTFSSKNEWKRHIASQHLQLGFFRCDVGNCNDGHKSNKNKYGSIANPTRSRSASHDHPARQMNDFNRKDLFTQHQRRMHAPWVLEGRSDAANIQERQAFESSLDDVRARCWREQRKPPPQSRCGFCGQEFTGPHSWNDRMEHVGRHFEKNGQPCEEKEDVALRDWALGEGIIRRDNKGKWVLTALCE